MEDLGNLIILIPPIWEQRSILDYTKIKSSKIQNTMKLLITQIEKLKEYKTTLINSAVTGKIKVFEPA